MNYTVELYKTDKRKKTGKLLIDRSEFDAATKEQAESTETIYLEGMRSRYGKGSEKLFTELHITYRDVRNAMNGKIVQEHYLTPFSCSAASESYWCS